MPCPPFILSRETERAAIDRVIRDPAKRQLLYDMVDAVLRVRESGKVTEAELVPIRAGFDSPNEGVWGRAGGWLAKIVAFAPETVSLVQGLASHRSAGVRFRLCASLSESRFSDAVVLPLLRRLLTDRSKRVRDTAAGVCLRRQITDLLPELESELAGEREPGRRHDLERAIALIKGEAYVEATGRYITRRTADGNIESSPC